MKEIKLFDYQEDMKGRIEKTLCLQRSVMVQMPTGTGKTHLLAAIVRDFVGQEAKAVVWIVAHRRELVAQIDETLVRYGVTPEEHRIKAMSIQWLARHCDEIGDVPGLIVIDEAHHALAKTYKMMWKRFPKAKFLGLTATPCRLSGKGFTDLFEVLVQSWSIPEFIKQGRLTAYDFVSIKTDSVTQGLIESLKKRGADGDYQTMEMDRVLNKKPSIERLFQSFEDFARDKKGIVYAINISHARKIAAFYQEHGVNAVAIDSKTPVEERKRMIELFKSSNTNGTDSSLPIQVLVNVDIFSEGFDCPDVEFVQLARPTLSLAKYLQMVGRGLRVTKGKKSCMMIDNVGLYRVFGLPSQVWNWEAMFLGEEKRRRRRETAKERDFFLMSEKQENMLGCHDSEMMMVVNHEELLQKLQYREFVDCKGDFAIIKLPDAKMTVVNRQGEQVIEPGNYYDMKLLRGNILFFRPRRNASCYYDLLAKAYIEDGPDAGDPPKVVHMNGWEFIEYEGLFISRTYEEFSLPYRPSKYDLANRGYYLAYYFHHTTDSGCQVWIYSGNGGAMYLDSENSEVVCFLKGDHTHVYWLCANLYENGIVVMDSKEDYYWVDDSLKKTYIGCNNPKDEKESLWVVMPRIGKECYQKSILRKEKKEEEELLQLHEKSNAGNMELYQAGKKWGIKMDGKVVVPPIYLQISQPVGAYCAFEQIPRHWGVMTLKGKVLVEPKYEKVEIGTDGVAILSTVVGKRETLRLR